MTGLSYNLMPRDDDESPADVQDSPQLFAGADALLGRLYGFDAVDEETPIVPRTQENLHNVVASLYTELRPRLYSYLHNTMNVSADQSDEVIQEAFLRLTAKLATGERILNPHGWVVRVARNLVFDLQKKRRRIEDEHQEAAILNERVDPALNQEQQLLSEEKILRVNQALGRMSPHHRECFEMRALGFRYTEIGEALNIGEGRAREIVKLVTGRLAVICA